MFGKIRALFVEAAENFVADEALTRGAAIAFYTATSIAPVLLIVIAVAGIAFGREAAQNAIAAELTGLMGADTAQFLQSIIVNASNKTSGALSTALGFLTLLVAASGVFGEMQGALNAIWKVETKVSTVSRFLRARAASLGLVVSLGFLLAVSLVASAGLTALSGFLEARMPFARYALLALNAIVSFGLIAALFGAIYKVLPDRRLEWRDVALGAVASTTLFTLGKFLIGLYLGSSGVASAYGAAGALILLLFWIYYSAETFLFGAEFTKAYAHAFGSRQDKPIEEKVVRV